MAVVPVPHTWTPGDDATAASLQSLTASISWLLTPPRARLRNGAQQSIPTGAQTNVTFDTIDALSDLTLASSVLTVQTPGVYLIAGYFGFSGTSGGSGRNLDLMINGARTATQSIPTNPSYDPADLSITAEIALVVGQTIGLAVLQDSGGSISADSSSWRQSRLTARWVGNP